MKLALMVLLALAALATGRPDDLLGVDLEDIHHDQDIDEGVITGRYTWTSPEGDQHFVSYVADEDGYRVVESDVVPASDAGVRADGNQGSFVSLEDLEDDDK